MKNIIIFLITCYQYLISPLTGSTCRFTPTCSNYTKDSILFHGVTKGLYYSIKRIFRCHPFCSGGYDPVPGASSWHPREGGDPENVDKYNTRFPPARG